MMTHSFLLLLIIPFHKQLLFLNSSFPINEIYPWKVIPYHIGYIVQNEVSGDTIVINFHATTVNNKKQYFWLFSLGICVRGIHFTFI